MHQQQHADQIERANETRSIHLMWFLINIFEGQPEILYI